MPPPAVLVARVPVLHRAVLDLGVFVGDELDHGGVELVLVALGSRAPLEVRHVGAFLGDHERALELARVGRVDPEVGRQLHRAAHALRDVDERAVREHGAVECREVVVGHRDDGSEVLLHELRMVLDRFPEAHEQDAELAELLLEGRSDGHTVEDGVDCDTGQGGALGEGDPQLLEGLENLGVDLVEALRTLLRRREVAVGLVVDRRVLELRPPVRLLHLLPGRERLQPPLEEPLGLVLLRADEPDDGLVQTGRQVVLLDVGDEPVLVVAGPFDELVDFALLGFDFVHFAAPETGTAGTWGRSPARRSARV
jgi:hypothetical protein